MAYGKEAAAQTDTNKQRQGCVREARQQSAKKSTNGFEMGAACGAGSPSQSGYHLIWSVWS